MMILVSEFLMHTFQNKEFIAYSFFLYEYSILKYIFDTLKYGPTFFVFAQDIKNILIVVYTSSKCSRVFLTVLLATALKHFIHTQIMLSL